MLKGKRKNQWNNSSTVKEDQLKVTRCNIFVCGVRTLYVLLYWSSHRNVVDCTVSVCSSYCKTWHILNFSIRMRWRHQKISHWGNSHRYLFDRRVGEFHSQSEHSREETISARASNWTALYISYRKMFIVYCIECWRNWVYDTLGMCLVLC